MADQAPTALITGASMGIGLEFARVFAEKKRNLVLVARSADLLEQIARDLHQKHLVKVKVIAKDLTQMNALDELVREASADGTQIDYLVNNAGFGDVGSITKTSWDKEHRMIQLNIAALTFLTKHYAKEMEKRGSGRILNVASTAAFQPGPHMSVYFATKAYVLSFSEAIAEELCGKGVTVTTLCPGATQSNFFQTANAEGVPLFKERKLPTAESVARYGYDAMMKGKRVAIHGWVNYIGAESTRLVPRTLLTKIVKQVLVSKRHPDRH